MNFDAFPERLKACLGDESVYGFAKRCDMSEGLLRRYLAGQSLPGMDKLVTMAQAAKVAIEWLATGVGPMRPTDADGRAPPDRAGSLVVDKLRAAITIVKDAVAAGNHDVTSAQEAEIATGVYELLTSGPPDPMTLRSVVDHMLRAVTAGAKK